MYLMWIWETIMCLSTELQRGTVHCLMAGEETSFHMFLCGTEGHSLAVVPSWTAAYWGVSERLEAGGGNLFTLGYSWEAELLCSPSTTTLESISCALGGTNVEDLWDVSKLLLGKDDAYDFIALYTFSIHLLLHPAFLKASPSAQELYLLWIALGAVGFSLTHLWQLPQWHGDKDIAAL